MRLEDQHIDFISNNLELYGLKNQSLKEDILDHICTYIEQSEETNFDKVYQKAIHKFGGYLHINHIQQETNLQLYFKNAKNRNTLLIIIGYLTSTLMTTGILFKTMHWPYANIMLFSGALLLILITLPLYFYSKYKDQLLKYQS